MFNEFYKIVSKIPKGNVLTYGQVAKLAGFPRCARQVGFALHKNPDPKAVPCHRVVFADGSLSPAFAFGGAGEHRRRLESEGITFTGDKVNMKTHNLL